MPKQNHTAVKKERDNKVHVARAPNPPQPPTAAVLAEQVEVANMMAYYCSVELATGHVNLMGPVEVSFYPHRQSPEAMAAYNEHVAASKLAMALRSNLDHMHTNLLAKQRELEIAQQQKADLERQLADAKREIEEADTEETQLPEYY